MVIKVSHITRRNIQNSVFPSGVQPITKTKEAYGAVDGKKIMCIEGSTSCKLQKITLQQKLKTQNKDCLSHHEINTFRSLVTLGLKMEGVFSTGHEANMQVAACYYS